MGLSETVVASLIGALATITASVFQLMRTRAGADTRPRRSRIRSTIAIAALMFACAVAGYAFAELRAVGAREEIAALRRELAVQLQAVAAATARIGQTTAREASVAMPAAAEAAAAGAAFTSSEALAHLPPCRLGAADEAAGPAACSEATVQRVALCAGLPEGVREPRVQLFARGMQDDSSWRLADGSAAAAVQVRQAGNAFEFGIGSTSRALCVPLGNWSMEESYAVRLQVEWGAPDIRTVGLVTPD